MFESWASRKIQDLDDDQKQEHDGGASPTSKNVVENGRTERMEWTADNSSRNLEKTSWSSCGSFAERLAARANSATTDRPNTARFKCMPPSRLPISRSNCLNIPPGLSATTLLDSPILLSTSQSEPSPTTGKFPLAPFITCSASRGLLGTNTSKELNVEQGSTLDFSFKPLSKQCLWNPLSPLSSLVRKIRVVGQFDHLLSTPMVQSQSELKSTTMGISKTLSSIGSLSDQKGIAAFNSNITVLNVEPLQAKEPFPVEKPPAQGSPMDACVISEQDQKVVIICQSLLEGSGHDGYNWRKYGKKQVKGSEHPRNYYKCTQANCNAKKRVKQTEDGQMMEIVYEGDHNHHKPQLTRRMHGALWESAAAAAAVENVESGAKSQDPQAIPGVPETQSEEKGNHSDKPSQVSVSAAKDDMPASYLVNPISPRSREALNATLLTEAQNAGHLKPLVIADGAIGAFLPSTRDDLREDAKDLGTSIKSSIDDCSEEEADLKRRKLDKSEKETAITPRTPRERRVVVETTSSVDFLEDGYRWRKYGQKNVKGNPNPRSYYKCANAGCPVRKQVERSSENSEAVITTYEGKHNHDIPAPRYSGQDIGVVHVVQSQNGSNALNVASAIPSVSTDQDKGSELQESLSAARSTRKNTDTTKASIADFGAELITKSEGNKVGKHGVSRDFGSQDDAFLDSNTTEHPNARFQRGILLVNVADGTESLNKQEHLKSKDERDNNHSHGSSFLLRLTSSTASVLHQSIPPTVTNGPLISS